MPLPRDLIQDIRDLLLPLVGDPLKREAILVDAFYWTPDSRLFNQISREGDAYVFSVRLLHTCDVFGCMPPDNQHSVSLLLAALRYYCNHRNQKLIDRLVPHANAHCGEATPPVPLPITPPLAPVTPLQNSDTPLEQRSATVFISYANADMDVAKRLIGDLQARGHACWIDVSKIKGGDEWMASIRDGINTSYAFVILCTRQALSSRWVRDEILWARQKNKLIVPLLLEDVTHEEDFFGLHTYQGIFLTDYDDMLQRLLDVLPAPRITAESAPEVHIVSQRQLEFAYLDRLRFEDFRLEKFELAEYVSLGGDAQRRQTNHDDWDRLRMEQEFAVIPMAKRSDMEIDAPPEKFTDAVSKIIELRRVVVLGEPGAGKTHTLRALAKPLYTAALNDPTAPIPLLVKLGNWDKPEMPFEAFLREALGELGAYLNDLLAAKRAVLLFDGLNEFPADQRKDKYPQIEAFIKAHPDIMAVVTCREADYPISLHLNKVLIRPLDPLRIRDFARRALRAVETDDAFFWKLVGTDARRFEARFKTLFADKRSDWETVFWVHDTLPAGMEWKQEFINGWYTGWYGWRALRDNAAAILTLARNPYMLRMLLDVYIQSNGDLPTNRGQLFDQFVIVLLKREHLVDKETEVLTEEGKALLNGLQHIAYEMQMRRAEEQKGSETSAGTSLDLAAVRGILDERLLYLAVSTSILTTGDEVRFSHQLLQEYFAARYMETEIKAGRLQAFDIWKPDNWWERTNWEEAVILLAGLYSDDCTPVLNWLADANPEVSALCVVRSGAKLPDVARERLRTEWLPRLTDLKRDPDPRARAAVGRALGLTNWDNRKGVNVVLLPSPRAAEGEGQGVRALPDIDWVTIPAGEFTYQNGKMTLDYDFQISRYPVTYAQFQAFVDDAEGFYEPRWWEGLAIPDGHNAVVPGDQAFKYWNHPVPLPKVEPVKSRVFQ
jgi:hypothetical protein